MFENADLRYAFAAYKKGGLKDFNLPDDLEPNDFNEAFIQKVSENFHFAWTMIAKSSNGMIPIGFVFGINNGTYLHIGSLTFFPWATDRNILEGVTKFLDEIRGNTMALWLTEEKNVLFQKIAKTKIIRRVGTVYDFIDSKYAQYQTVATA